MNAAGHHVGVKNHLAVHVPRRATGRLDQTRRAAQITFLVGIEDGDERYFGQVQSFAEQIDPDQHVEVAFAQGAQYFDPFDGVNLAVQVSHVDADVAQVIGQLLGRAFGERGDEDPLLPFHAFARFFDQVVDLAAKRFDRDPGIDQAGRAHHQFSHPAARPFDLAFARRRAHIDGLLLKLLKLLETQRAIVQRARQPKAVFHQNFFARNVAGVHAAQLRNRGVRFVDHQQVVFRNEIQQRVRPRSRRAPANVARVVLDARADPHFQQHFQVVFGPHLQTLRLQ